MTAWDDVRRWRVQKRKELVERRRAVRRPLKDFVRTAVRDEVIKIIKAEESDHLVIGGYWPIKGEIDLMPLLREFSAQDYHIALPVVVEKEKPVEFWKWQPDMSMSRGFWGIPVPPNRDPVVPDIILVPLLGYDDACFRLGNGGGYYDRTLAAMRNKPLCIGVGYAFTRQQTIFPQEHDIRMDVIVTEDGSFRQGYAVKDEVASLESTGDLASSPCFMDTANPEYFGFMSASENLELILVLWSAIRECADIAMEIMLFGRKTLDAKIYLDMIYMDIHACAILRQAIDRLVGCLDGKSTNAVLADAPDSSAASSTHSSLIDIRYRLAETIRMALPKISDLHLYENLASILRFQERALRHLSGPENLLHKSGELKNAG